MLMIYTLVPCSAPTVRRARMRTRGQRNYFQLRPSFINALNVLFRITRAAGIKHLH